MSLRSTTGCSTCKTKRKKCDETKPKCLKCVQKGLNCEYQYVEPTGRGTRIRTKPAPRPPSEQAKLLAKQQASLKEASELVNVAEGLETPAELFEPSLAPPIEATVPPDTDWSALLYEPVAIPSLGSVSTQVVLSPPMAPPDLPLPRILTSGQASLFDALFSLDKDGSAWRVDDRSNSALLTSSNEHMSDQPRPIVHPPLDLVPDTDTSEYEDDEDDQGPGEVFYQTPIVLDRTVDSNLLVFVLHSYAQFMPLVIFDPLKAGSRTKHTVVNRFLGSEISRSRVLLISEVARRLSKSPNLDERGEKMLLSLGEQVWGNVMSYQTQVWPPSEDERKRANAALVHIVEALNIHAITAPLGSILSLLRSAAPVFLCACPPPHPPHMADLLLTIRDDIVLGHFAVCDVVTSVVTGRPLLCRYHVPWSLELCNEFTKDENLGLRWLFGIPDQFVMLFAYMDGLWKDAKASGTTVDLDIIQRIEEDIGNIDILPCRTSDSSLAIGRMVVQECWRQVVFVYLYMASWRTQRFVIAILTYPKVLCEANALDHRVKKAQKGFMKLLKATKPRRNPDVFTIMPMIIAGAVTTKSTHRQIIISRFLSMPEFANPGVAGNDLLRMLEDIWARTNMEGRPARWEDLREACQRVIGI
ncbi:hypothetical protein RHS02_04372, partial [Rhizoctonia solani]